MVREFLRHLRAIHGYIAEDSITAAEAQTERIRRVVERLRGFLRSGRMILRIERDDVREVIVGNYRGAYNLVDDKVVIAAIHHGARRLKWSE